MALWPFRNMIMRAPQRAAPEAAASPTAAAAVAAAADEQPSGLRIPDCVASGAGPEAAEESRLKVKKRREQLQQQREQQQRVSAKAGRATSQGV